jgi:WD40 repeat protein
VWDTATLREVAHLPGGGLSVAFSPDGKRLATGGAGESAVTLWDLESQQELLALAGEGSNFWRSEFSPDGNVLGSENMKGALHLWRAPSWAEIEAAESQPANDAQAH